MTTPTPDDGGEALIPTLAPAHPPSPAPLREVVQSTQQLKKLFKSRGLNDEAIRAFAQLQTPDDVRKLQDVVSDAPEAINKLHAHLREYGVDAWLKDNFRKGAPPETSHAIDKLPSNPQPQQGSLRPPSSTTGPHGGTTVEASTSQSVVPTPPTSAPPSQGTAPKWRAPKRAKHNHKPVAQGEEQAEFMCPWCHKTYQKRGWFQGHFANDHYLKRLGTTYQENHLFSCGLCPSHLGQYSGGDIHATRAYQGIDALLDHMADEHSTFQKDKVQWNVDYAIRSILWHDEFGSKWREFLNYVHGHQASLLVLTWISPQKEQEHWQLLADLQKAGAPSLPQVAPAVQEVHHTAEYVPGQQLNTSLQSLFIRAYQLAEKHLQASNAVSLAPQETIVWRPVTPGSEIYATGDQFGNPALDPMSLTPYQFGQPSGFNYNQNHNDNMGPAGHAQFQ